MVSLVTRNVRENNSPAPLHDDLAMQPVLSINSQIRAEEINLLIDQYNRLEVSAVICAAKMGNILRLEKAEFDGTFEQFLAEKCPRLSRTTAYNRMKLAEKNPELLSNSDAIQTAGQLLKEGHYVELFSAPDEVKALVHEKVAAGEAVSRSEIIKYKNAAKKSEQEAAQARKDADEWRVSMQTQQAINQQNLDLIDKKADEKLKIKAAEIEQAAIEFVTAEYQAKIDAQTDKISELRNQLKLGDKEKIEAEIAQLQEERQKLVIANNQDAYEVQLSTIAKMIVEDATHANTALIHAGTTSLTITDKTYSSIMDAHETLQKLSQRLFEIANPATLTIED